jgi:hypothetical protein
VSKFQKKKNHRYVMVAKKKRYEMVVRIRPKKPSDHTTSRVGEELLGDFRIGE